MSDYELSKIEEFYGAAVRDIWEYLLSLEAKKSRPSETTPRKVRRITHTIYSCRHLQGERRL